MINENVLYYFTSDEWGELKHLYSLFQQRIPVVLEQCLNAIIHSNAQIIKSEDELAIVIQFLRFVLEFYSGESKKRKKSQLEINDEVKNQVDSVNSLIVTLINLYTNLERIRAQEEDFSYGHE